MGDEVGQGYPLSTARTRTGGAHAGRRTFLFYWIVLEVGEKVINMKRGLKSLGCNL